MTTTLKPILLRPDNFTPPSRTPWGGTKILNYKKGLQLAEPVPTRVGESWEVSVVADFPSRCAEDDVPLAAKLAEDLQAHLGKEADCGRKATALLVKLLDAQDDLSVQIHPSDVYPALAPDEAGKPESWYVLESEKGSGIYLGLKKEVDQKQVRECLSQQLDLSQLLNFVPVQPGDFFLVRAGTPHAIGKGVTLLEPQHVVPGKTGVTYRYWDWNRRYNSEGELDPKGEGRTLHLEHALAVTDWDAERGSRFVNSCHFRPPTASLSSPAQLHSLCGKNAALQSEHLQVARLTGHGKYVLGEADYLRSLTVVAGSLDVTTAGTQALTVPCGQSAVLPAALKEVKLRLESAQALICAVRCP